LITGFLDANVLANWTLLDAVIAIGKYSKNDLLSSLEKEKYSYLLLEEARTNKRFHRCLLSSRLAFGETLSVLIKEYLMNRMKTQGIPFRYMNREAEKLSLTATDRNDLSRQIERLRTQFFEPIGTAPVQYVEDGYEFDDLLVLMMENKVDLYDATLVSTAYRRNCQYFITDDERLRDRFPKKQFHSMSMMSAKHFLTNIMRNYTKDTDSSEFLLLSHGRH